MNLDDEDNSGFVSAQGEDESRSAVNSLILDYYKKFGRKRDLEQYFSLSTAQTDLRDPSSTFWRKMKSENDSSDSGEKKSESSQEVCRISIRCAVPEPSTSQEEDSKTKSESVSPPIITEEVSHDSGQNSDVESQKSDDNNSQKSYDILLDTSMNKPLSPSSSITSQRKLEWDSLADVGYANESDRKTSASSLSTLERLALIQQYSNNDNQSTNIGPPTSHSTPLDENEPKNKTRKGFGKKSTKIYKKDIDLVEFNVPQSSDNPTQSINVNLTKHISFNVEKDGKTTVENVEKNISVSPEKVTKEDQSKAVTDKEIQTSLLRTKDIGLQRDSSTAQEERKPTENSANKIPVMISLNTLRKKTRRKRIKMARRRLKAKKKSKEIVKEKSIEQLSEAESFEYMPGHIYNQNQLQAQEERPSNAAGNKSSLESSGVLTTDSSKRSAHSFTKDLEKSIELLRNALRDRCDDSDLRKQLIKQICERLIKSKYRDDDSTSDFLSNFTFRSKKTIERNVTTTSTSDANDSSDKLNKPKKSILRNDKFNAGAIASTSQSAPNLPVATDSEKPVTSKLAKTLLTSNTDSDLSKTSSDNVFAKTSSEELYQKYLAALRREQAYKRHLKDKEVFLKQKLVNSDGAFNITPRDAKVNSRLQDLIKDLTRNNYDDGSGDASKLEGGPNSNTDFDRLLPIRTQRSHSVFTLSSGNSDYQNKKSNLKKKLQYNLKDMTKPGTSKDHYCCCPHHSNRFGVTDSSVQVNIEGPCDGDSSEIPRSRNNSPKRYTSPRPNNRRNSPKCSPRKDMSKYTKFVCPCSIKTVKNIDDLLIYKSAKPMNKGDSCSDKCSLQSNTSCSSKNQNHPTTSKDCGCKKPEETKHDCQSLKKSSKSSQTNLLLKMLSRQSSDRSVTCSCSDSKNSAHGTKCSNNILRPSPTYTKVFEATRCIQTEISINPKISDPTLSDVNIVNDSSCAKLICEGCREVPKSSVTDIYSCDLLNQATFSGSSKSTKSSGTSKNVEEIKDELNEESDKIHSLQQCIPSQSNVEKLDDFEIPIQGTNMTLLVSINSNERKIFGITATENATVATDVIEKHEQATSLTEECSRGVQVEDIRALDLNSNNNNNNLNNKYFNEKLRTTRDINPCLSGAQPFNTYPRSPVNEQKPFIRSNTDIAKLERTFGQIDIMKENLSSNPCSVNSQKSKQCSCGCGQKDCNNKCLEQNSKTPRDDKQCSCGCDQKDSNNKCLEQKCSVSSQTSNKCIVQNSTTPKPSKVDKQCSCGCSQTDCNNKCLEQNSTTCDETPKVDKQCSCGCGQKDCNNKCVEQKCSVSSQTSNKCIIQNSTTPKLDKQCSCGCSQTDCNNKCFEQNSTTSNETPKVDKQCSCGCDQKDCNNKCIQSGDTSSKCINILDDTKKCSCGCQNKDCNNKCLQRNSSSSASCNKLSDNKQNNQGLKNLDNTNSKGVKLTKEKCDCSCSKNKDECGKECVKCKTMTSNSCIKDNSKCLCGCGNENNCKMKCSEVNPQGSSSKKEIGIQKSVDSDSMPPSKGDQVICNMTKVTSKHTEANILKLDKDTDQSTNDPIISMIQNITKRYTKKELEKSERKNCFKEIMNVLKYLVETEDSSDHNEGCTPRESTTPPISETVNFESQDTVPVKELEKPLPCGQAKNSVDKGIQLSPKKSKKHCTESSDFCSTDFPGTSSDSATCKVLNKIKKECEKYHLKRCKCHWKKCDGSSSTSVNCDQCRRVHHCYCRIHKCKSKKCNNQQSAKKPVAYNLILQTSNSIASEDAPCQSKQLKNIIVKVPPKQKVRENMPFKELEAKIESRMCQTSQAEPKCCRSRSLPNESDISSLEEIIRKTQACTMREYLEKNRPDFVENCAQRRNCLKIVKGARANERAVKRELLLLRLSQLSDVKDIDSDDLQELARELGRHLREKKPQPKLISEREMKKHSEKIYKSLPEVVRKKEDAKKENEKKTNLLMASIFKKNLQKKTLRGSVNISNYSSIVKI